MKINNKNAYDRTLWYAFANEESLIYLHWKGIFQRWKRIERKEALERAFFVMGYELLTH